MVAINYAFREVSCKIVYYGPGLSGKTTNLQYVHKKVPTQVRGELISLATDTDRTLFFDFLPLNLGAIQGFSTKFQLYTVPGQVFYNATRKLVLRGVDGLVFVADSQLSKMEENKESLSNLLENLKSYGYQLEEIPFLIQYNKRDLPDVATVEQLQDTLNHWRVPYYEAVASKGIGVFDTLKGICKLVIENLRAKTQISAAAEAQAPTQSAVPAEAARPAVTPVSQKPAPLGREIDTTEVIPSQIRERFQPLQASASRPAASLQVEEKVAVTTAPHRLDRIPEFRTTAQPRSASSTSKLPALKSDLDWKPVVGRPGRPRIDDKPKPKSPGIFKRLFRFIFGG